MNKLLPIDNGLMPIWKPCYNDFKHKKVEEKLNNEFAELSANLAAIAVKNTSAVIYQKIKAVKASKDDKSTIAELTDIINNLIEENQELTMISKGFEKELVSQQLSESDIKMVSENFVPVLKNFAEKQGESVDEMLDSIEMLEPLISKNTLDVLQVLGFNFKRAIGEPLTELLNNKINSYQSINDETYKALTMQREIEYIKLFRDPDSYERYKETFGK